MDTTSGRPAIERRFASPGNGMRLSVVVSTGAKNEESCRPVVSLMQVAGNSGRFKAEEKGAVPVHVAGAGSRPSDQHHQRGRFSGDRFPHEYVAGSN